MLKFFFKRWSMVSFFSMIFPLLFALPLFALGAITSLNDSKFADEGIQAPAIVQDRWEEESTDSEGDDVISYYISYSFETKNGDEVKSKTSIGSDDWDGMAPDTEVHITYLESNPTETRLVGDDGIGWIFLLLSMIPGGVALFFLIKNLKAAARSSYLEKNGAETKAKITDIKKSSYQVNDVYYRYICYEFQGPSGSVTGKTRALKPSKVRKYDEGDEISVFYDPKDPSKNEFFGV